MNTQLLRSCSDLEGRYRQATAMRIPKTLASTSRLHLWILALAMGVVALALLSISKTNADGLASRLSDKFQYPAGIPSSTENADLPVFAYWIFGSNGDGGKIMRLVKAVYHPRNQYLLQLDADSSDFERADLAISVQSIRVFEAFGNVDVVGKSYALNRMGSSIVAATLHAAALLLKISSDWDWFVPLSSSDYPLLAQDDLLHAFAFLPRDLNFLHFTNKTDWKERTNINQIVVDPSLYFQKRAPIFYASEIRDMPDAFKIYGGSPWMILTRTFLEYCVQGWENLPRKLLLYFSNVANPLESYFHTVLCNSPQFQNTTTDTDLRYVMQDLPMLERRKELNTVLASIAAFTVELRDNDMLRSEIDKNVLGRPASGLVPGEWCFNRNTNQSREESTKTDDQELCSSSTSGSIDDVKPGSYGNRLRAFLSDLAKEGKLRTNQCHQ